MYIYALHNLKNGKLYIGQTTVSIEKRYIQHRSDSKREDTKLYRAMRKYGVDSFIYYEVDQADSLEDLNSKEDYWIHKLDTIKNGYNTKGGGGNAKHSKETREKISKYAKTRTYSEETRLKMSESAKLRDTSHLHKFKKGHISQFLGKKRPGLAAKHRERLKNGIPQSTKDKISAALKGRFSGENHPSYGIKVSEAQKEILRNLAPKTAIKCIETGEEFESISEASRKLGISRSSIVKTINDKRSSRCGLTFIKLQVEG